MKRAQLPDGQNIDFPDEADDDRMDRAVKAYLGAEEKEDAPDEVLNEIKALRQAVKALADSQKMVAKAIIASGEETISATKAVAKAVKELKAPEVDVGPVGDAIADAVDAAVKKVVAVLSAPKRLAIEKGKIVGVERTTIDE